MDNLGTGVSYVYDEGGYNYERVVFQKGKPILTPSSMLLKAMRAFLGDVSLLIPHVAG